MAQGMKRKTYNVLKKLSSNPVGLVIAEAQAFSGYGRVTPQQVKAAQQRVQPGYTEVKLKAVA